MSLKLRSARDVAHRLLVLAAVSEAAHRQPPTEIRAWIARNGLEPAVSNWERAFLALDKAPHDTLAAASWRLEACAVLSWAIGRVATLPPAVEQISLETAGVTEVLLSDPGHLIASSSLRSEEELSEMQMDIEAQHWGIRAGPAGRRLFPHPASREDLNPAIVYQRHYAINWVLGYGDDWDSVTTDT